MIPTAIRKGAASAVEDSLAAMAKTIPWRPVLSASYLSLGVVVLLSATLNFIALRSEGYANTYYAAAVKSMLQNWHNFFFVVFDPGGFVAVDKPPLGLWLQTASAKLLGFSRASLLLPQGIATVLSVIVLYRLIAPRFGHAARLLAALTLALTPVASELVGHHGGGERRECRQEDYGDADSSRLGSGGLPSMTRSVFS